MNDEYETRVAAIRRYLEGEPPGKIYTSLNRSPVWFFKWKKQYDSYGLDGLRDRSKAPKHQPHQTPAALETAIITIRKLREKRERDDTRYALIGAFAIHQELEKLGYAAPSVRTVHKILVRHGLIVAPPEPPAVCDILDRHYPGLKISRPGQVQQFDLIGPRYLTGSSQKYYFYHVRDVCSRKIAIEVGMNHQARTIVNALIQIWQRLGTPTVLQHDNALEFRGSNRHPRSAGMLTKLCLALGVESLFIPSHQPYRNGSIENCNGLFQRLVLHTHQIEDFPQLQKETQGFEVAANTQHPHVPLNGKTSEEYEQRVGFLPTLLPKNFTLSSRFHFTEPPAGKVSFICRIRKSGKITIATEKFEIDSDLAWDYIYATIYVKEHVLKIYHQGQVIKEFPYELKT